MFGVPSDRDNGCQFGALLKPSIAAIELRIFLNLNTPYLPFGEIEQRRNADMTNI